MGYMSEEEILQFAKEQMSLREIAKIKELQENVAKLEMQVGILLDIYNEPKESDGEKKKKD